MSKSLLERFKNKYEEGTSFKVGRHFFDKKGDLRVVIVNATEKELFKLTVKEYPNGEIYWY
ncbi:hypothetical protein PMY12_15645 [Clostridium tertium]|uniref:hypothetical protein n=1 Tax=Clostridium tertium TaxID=1559 RepID=UPI00232AC514|nr:hypothetical protein [Clostridium tertium]MDB1935104.1 hypothetical protein [Clostridium tertium]MDB1938441.1 hypothetical protein [Clostridium tertium]